MINSFAGPEIERLINTLAKLPGMGPRSARRAVLAMMKSKDKVMRPLLLALSDAIDKVHPCTVCGNIDSIDPCAICIDDKRDQGLVCVVEDVSDLWALERSHAHKGVYHVLGGTLSAIDGVGPDDLNIPKLIKKAASNQVREVIVATNATVDGQTTANYISDQLANCNVTLTRLAHGVPVGGELDYLDDGTLTAAMHARRPV